MSKKPRILIIDNSKQVTGAFKSIMGYVTQLRSKYDFIWVIPKESSIPKFLGDYNFYQLSFLEISKKAQTILYPIVLLRNAFLIRKIILKENISILHVNDLYNMTGVLVKLFMPSIKLIYYVRLLPTSYIGSFFFFFRKLILLKSDKIIVVSTAVNEYFASEDTVLVHDTFPAPNLGLEYPTPFQHEVVQVVYVGAFIEGKGQDLAVGVFRRCYAKYSNVHLTFIGSYDPESSYFNSIREAISEGELENVISFTGHQDQLEKFYANTDIAFNFSVSESFSMTCLEASYWGIPILSTNSGGPADIILDHESGFIVDAADIEDIVNKVCYLIENESRRKLMGRSGRLLVEKKFNLDALVSILECVYSTALAKEG